MADNTSWDNRKIVIRNALTKYYPLDPGSIEEFVDDRHEEAWTACFTHRSKSIITPDGPRNYEIAEFLGDTEAKAGATKFFTLRPERFTDAELTNLAAHYLAKEVFSDFGRSLKFDTVVSINKELSNTRGHMTHVQEDLFEAFIGTLSIVGDQIGGRGFGSIVAQGYTANIVSAHFDPDIAYQGNAKSQLGEIVKAIGVMLDYNTGPGDLIFPSKILENNKYIFSAITATESKVGAEYTHRLQVTFNEEMPESLSMSQFIDFAILKIKNLGPTTMQILKSLQDFIRDPIYDKMPTFRTTQEALTEVAGFTINDRDMVEMSQTFGWDTVDTGAIVLTRKVEAITLIKERLEEVLTLAVPYSGRQTMILGSSRPHFHKQFATAEASQEALTNLRKVGLDMAYLQKSIFATHARANLVGDTVDEIITEYLEVLRMVYDTEILTDSKPGDYSPYFRMQERKYADADMTSVIIVYSNSHGRQTVPYREPGVTKSVSAVEWESIWRNFFASQYALRA